MLLFSIKIISTFVGAQWLSVRVLDSSPRGRGFEPHRRHCVVSLSKNINPILVLVQPRKTRPFITERLLMGRKESNQTNKQSTFAITSHISVSPYPVLRTFYITNRLQGHTSLNTDCFTGSILYEPRHEISNNMKCATSKGSDQPVHMQSLVRAFASHLNILCLLNY